MFVSTAFAQAAAPAGGIEQSLQPILMMGLIFVVFYFLLLRPQQKRMKQHKEMLAALRRGDRVLTGGGIYGTVTKIVGETEVVIEIAEGTRVRVARPSIQEVIAKTEPVAGAKDEAETEK